MTTTLTFHPTTNTALDLTVDGNDVELTTREVDAYGVVVTLPLPVLRTTLDVLAAEQDQSNADMDGGVAAALIEQETATVSPALLEAALAAAIKDGQALTQERDEAREEAASLFRQLADAQRDADMSRAEMESEQPRPLTPDMVDEAMRERATAVFGEVFRKVGPGAALDAALLAAFTPPTLPEGAEELAEVLRTFPGTLAGIQDISAHLASRGVRVTGGAA